MNQADVIRRAFGHLAPIGWGIYGAESTWGKNGPASFGLTGDYPGRGTSGNFVHDAHRSADILRRLIRTEGSLEGALRKYSGGGYGVAHVKQLLSDRPFGHGALPIGPASAPSGGKLRVSGYTTMDRRGALLAGLLSGSSNPLLEAQRQLLSGAFDVRHAGKTITLPDGGAPAGGGGGTGGIIAIGKLGQRMGLHVGENPHFGTVHRVHVKGSYHYSGRAVDVSGTPAQMRAFAHAVVRLYGPHLKELFWQGPGGINIKNGKHVPQGFVTGHTDHVHVAF